MDLSKALSHGFPGKKWALNGNDLSGLIWLDTGSKPTQAQVNAAWDDFVANGEEPVTIEKMIEEVYAFKNAAVAKGLITDSEIDAEKK